MTRSLFASALSVVISEQSPKKSVPRWHYPCCVKEHISRGKTDVRYMLSKFDSHSSSPSASFGLRVSGFWCMIRNSYKAQPLPNTHWQTFVVTRNSCQHMINMHWQTYLYNTLPEKSKIFQTYRHTCSNVFIQRDNLLQIHIHPRTSVNISHHKQGHTHINIIGGNQFSDLYIYEHADNVECFKWINVLDIKYHMVKYYDEKARDYLVSTVI